MILMLLLGAPLFAEEEEEGELSIREEVTELWSEVKEAISNQPNWIAELEKIKDSYFDKEPEVLLEGMEELLELHEEEPGEVKSLVMSWVNGFKTWKLAESIKSAKDPSEKESKKTELRGLLKKTLEARIKEREQEVQELEKELKEIRAGLAKAKSNPDHFVERKMSELLEDEMDPFDW